jgi:hypothetical protein
VGNVGEGGESFRFVRRDEIDEACGGSLYPEYKAGALGEVYSGEVMIEMNGSVFWAGWRGSDCDRVGVGGRGFVDRAVEIVWSIRLKVEVEVERGRGERLLASVSVSIIIGDSIVEVEEMMLCL